MAGRAGNSVLPFSVQSRREMIASRFAAGCGVMKPAFGKLQDGRASGCSTRGAVL